MPLSRDDTDFIRNAYLEGVRRGRRDVAAGQQYLDERLEGAIGFSIGHVDKYSADQTAWAARRAQEEISRGRRRPVTIAELSRRPEILTGTDFQRYFPGGPEDGQETGVGNIFVAQGLTNLISLWLGLSATAINKLGGTQSVCGVGSGTAAPGTSDTTLIGQAGGSSYYQAFDGTASFGTTTTNGQLVGTSTYGSANANFAWNEWCWATGAGAITAGANLGTAAGSPFATANSAQMVNHKTNVNLGSKASGSSWVFSTTFTIS